MPTVSFEVTPSAKPSGEAGSAMPSSRRTRAGRSSEKSRRSSPLGCNINVGEFAGQVVALEEPALPIRFDPTTLETLGVYGYSDQIQGQISTAHPHRDTARQRHYNYMLQFGRKSTYRLFGIDSEAGRQEVIAELAVDRPAYMHSFGMSKQHLILTEFPLVVNPLRLRFSGRPFIENYRWEPERGLRFHVVEKDGGRVPVVALAMPDLPFIM